MEHLREELRIENLLHWERAFEREMAQRQACFDDSELHCILIVPRKVSVDLGPQARALPQQPLNPDSLGSDRRLPRLGPLLWLQLPFEKVNQEHFHAAV